MNLLCNNVFHFCWTESLRKKHEFLIIFERCNYYLSYIQFIFSLPGMQYHKISRETLIKR